ncbi:MAG: hypothetical protein QOG68_2631 [Solirubrobacteraceae bacterium]|nr:hypothetical protein [Solirubrobacteraceae bacterium]
MYAGTEGRLAFRPVLIGRRTLDQIVAGEVDLAFRRWERPRVRQGTRLRTAVGLIAVDAIEQVAPAKVTADDLRRAGIPLQTEDGRPLWRIVLRYDGPDPRVTLREDPRLDAEQLDALRARLARFDSQSAHGPWTRATLTLIAAQPATLAADLAAQVGREKLSFKRDVRKLKELGLTESLRIGYCLSPRGRALLDAL